MSDTQIKAPEKLDGQLPQAPSTISPSKGRKLVGYALAGLLVLGVGGAIASRDHTTTTTVPVNAPVAVNEPVATVDWNTAASLSQSVVDHLNNAMTYANTYDVDGMATELDAAGSDADQLATVTAPEPTVSGPIASSASHLHAAADYLRAGDIDSATSEIEAGTADVEQATTAMDAVV